jgi:hypothetical protein
MEGINGHTDAESVNYKNPRRTLCFIGIGVITAFSIGGAVFFAAHDARTPDEVQAVNDYDVAEGNVNYYLKTLAAIAQADRLSGGVLADGYRANIRALQNYLEDANANAEGYKKQLQSWAFGYPTLMRLKWQMK